MNPIKFILITSVILGACTGNNQANIKNHKEKTMTTDNTKQYGFNRDFLRKYISIIELKNGNSAIVLSPLWQGRVMTSTAEGDSGFSFGWINRELIASGKLVSHINPYGGEERLWLGPEGGQFSIFFNKGKSFIYDNWQTPAFLDTNPFQLISSTDSSALFGNDIETENYSGTSFKFRIEREVTLLTENEVTRLISIDVKGLKCVAYRSDNKIINKGDNEWKKETGLLSIWMLGMFNPSTAIIIT